MLSAQETATVADFGMWRSRRPRSLVKPISGCWCRLQRLGFRPCAEHLKIVKAQRVHGCGVGEKSGSEDERGKPYRKSSGNLEVLAICQAQDRPRARSLRKAV